MDTPDSKKQVVSEIIRTSIVPTISGLFFLLWVYALIKAPYPGIVVFPLVALLLFPLYFISGPVYAGLLLALVTMVNFLSVLLSPHNAIRFTLLLEAAWIWGIFFLLERYQNSYLNDQNKIREEEEIIENKISFWEVEIEEHERKRNNFARQIANYQSLGQLTQIFGSSLEEEKIQHMISEAAFRFLGRGTWRVKKGSHRDVYAKYVEQNKVPLLIRNITNDTRFYVERPKYASMVVVPLEMNGGYWGALEGMSPAPDTFDENDLRLLSILCSIASLALNNVMLYQRTQELAITDGLTGLYVQSYFKERLSEEIVLSRRHKLPLSIALIDIDHFKNFNDTYGHKAGDAILRQLSDLLRHRLRETDFVSRYGGEEFAIIMMQTDMREAYKVCEEIRRSIEEERFYLPVESFKPVQVHATVSIGIARFGESASTEKDLVLLSDEALYQAKHHGRNRVEMNMK